MWLALLMSAVISGNNLFVIRARSLGGAKKIETMKTKETKAESCKAKHYLDKEKVKNNMTEGKRPK